jgi:hypothetical protein
LYECMHVFPPCTRHVKTAGIGTARAPVLALGRVSPFASKPCS